MAVHKCRYLTKLTPVLRKMLGNRKADHIAENAQKIYEQLCAENTEEPKALHMHTRNSIYPAIAAFLAMLKEDIDRESAAELLYTYYEKRNEPIGNAIRSILKVPGLYRLVPRFFTRMTKKSFGETAGFRTKWLCTNKKEMQFDMLVCPYQDICLRYGCPEIVRSFCRADDICYGNMHSKLHWGRTKTLGLGGDCCDFRLTIR